MSLPWRNWVALLISAHLVLLLAFAVAAAPESGSVKAEPPPARKAPVVYKPPLRGAPPTRVGGGTRGEERGSVLITVLAPDHTGWTAKGQPTLYWYLSKSVNTPVELTVIDEASVKPLLETNVAIPVKAGIQSLPLADHRVRLEPGIEYRWSVALVVNQEQRSSDIVSSGTITYVEPLDELRKRFEQASPETLASIYAEAGYWYDAIDDLSKLIEKQSGSRHLKNQRAALLDQVGLPEAAAYDRK